MPRSAPPAASRPPADGVVRSRRQPFPGHRCSMRRRSCTTTKTPPRPRSPPSWAPAGQPSAACWRRRNGRASCASRWCRPQEARPGDLADRLARALGLANVYLQPSAARRPAPAARVVDVMGGALAPAVGRALSEAGLLPGDVLLVSSGRTVYEVAQYELTPLPGVVVAPTVGGNDQPEEWYQTNEITRLVANRVGGRRELPLRARTAGSGPVPVTAQRPQHPARAAPVAACALRADGRRRAAADAFGHPAVRPDRLDFAAVGRRRRVLAVLRPRRRAGRLRGTRPADRAANSKPCATFR